MTASTSQLEHALGRAAESSFSSVHVTGRVTLYVLLMLASVPDAMVPPMLRDLFIFRYGVSEGAAHWFMAVNLIGAACALPLLARLRQKASPITILAIAAAANALLLAVLAFPIGFGASLGLRVLEGAADILVLAVLFDLIVKSGDASSRGKRLGGASALLMLAVGGGLALGGVVGQQQPILVFLVGAVACLFVAVIACTTTHLHYAAQYDRHDAAWTGRARLVRQLWPTMSMALADRAIAGLFTATIPLYFVSQLDYSPARAGGLLALTMIVMAASSFPAGVLSDRLGHLRLRLVAAVGYAAAVLCIASASNMPDGALLMVMALIGLTGAALMPTSMALATRNDPGPVAVGALHAAGNVGFFLGIVGSGILLAVLRQTSPEIAAFPIVIAVVAGLHVLVTLVTTIAYAIRSRVAHRTLMNIATT